MGSETNDDILDVHHYGKTNCFLCCPDVMAKNQKKVCVNELTKLQRTACIGITEAFRTTPPAALEVAIGLTPLPLWIKGEARTSYFRICRFGNVTHCASEFQSGHCYGEHVQHENRYSDTEIFIC